jgi:hypothetical protein
LITVINWGFEIEYWVIMGVSFYFIVILSLLWFSSLDRRDCLYFYKNNDELKKKKLKNK